MKILMVTNKVRTYALGFQNSLDPLMSLGHEIIWAADFSMFRGDKAEIPCQIRQISINTWPLKKCNLDAYRQLLKIIEEEKIEAVVCSTPIGGLLARLAAKAKNIKPVIYAAHGFLFFKGAPLLNQTVYKWEEELLAHWTDALITITVEDYAAAQKFKLRSGRKPYLVHGAGVKTGVTVATGREEKRAELGIPQNAFVVVSAGDLVKYKNNSVIIEAVAKMQDLDVHYILCGEGDKRQEWTHLAQQLGVSDRVHFLGFRTDVAEIMACADVLAMPSLMEGVPRALLEAMDFGLPCIGTKTRGIEDLLGHNGEGGFLCPWKDADGFSAALTKLKSDPQLRARLGERNRQIVKEYSAECVSAELYQIYSEVLGKAIKQ